MATYKVPNIRLDYADQNKEYFEQFFNLLWW